MTTIGAGVAALSARIAVLFPGQSAAITGMTREWAKRSGHARRLLDEAARHVDIPLDRLHSPTTIARTSIFQPVLTALTLGIWREIEGRGVEAFVAAGHSLGELPAAAATGCMSDTDAVRVGAVRGRLMEREATLRPGGMIAIKANSRADAEATIAAAALTVAPGEIVVAGNNMRDQWVVSGAWPQVAQIAASPYAVPLQVGGAWHSPLMAGAAGEYREALEAVAKRPLDIPLVSNHRGVPVSDVREAIDLLVGQLTRGVDWVECMETFETLGVTDFIICGPARTVGRFVAAELQGRRIHVVEWPDDLERVREALVS